MISLKYFVFTFFFKYLVSSINLGGGGSSIRVCHQHIMTENLQVLVSFGYMYDVKTEEPYRTLTTSVINISKRHQRSKFRPLHPKLVMFLYDQFQTANQPVFDLNEQINRYMTSMKKQIANQPVYVLNEERKRKCWKGTSLWMESIARPFSWTQVTLA